MEGEAIITARADPSLTVQHKFQLLSDDFNPAVPTHDNFPFFIFFLIFIYLFMAVLGLRFCVRAFSSCGKWGPLFIAVRGPLTIAASLVAEHRLQTRKLSNCGSWGPAAPWHVGSSQTRARTRVPCIGRQILNHCATREAPFFILMEPLS